MENIKKMDLKQRQTKTQNVISISKLVMSFLLVIQEESNKHFHAIKFPYGQLKFIGTEYA